MALQFADQSALETDLQGKAGVYDTYGIINSDESLANTQAGTGIIRHDLAIGKKTIDADGTERITIAVQQVIEELDSGTWGYGNNRQWDLKDDSPTTFEQEFNTQAQTYVGATVGGATVLRIRTNSINSEDESGLLTGYFNDGSVQQALLYKDGSDAWQIQLLNTTN